MSCPVVSDFEEKKSDQLEATKEKLKKNEKRKKSFRILLAAKICRAGKKNKKATYRRPADKTKSKEHKIDLSKFKDFFS